VINSVTIKCKPAEIPEFLEIDVTDMEMNTNLFVKDITLPTDVEMLTAEDIAVVSVQEPKQEKEEVVEGTESIETDESPDTDEKPAEDEATEEGSEEAKDDVGDEG
jgi:large subunit ribosomal protein L25